MAKNQEFSKFQDRQIDFFLEQARFWRWLTKKREKTPDDYAKIGSIHIENGLVQFFIANDWPDHLIDDFLFERESRGISDDGDSLLLRRGVLQVQSS